MNKNEERKKMRDMSPANLLKYMQQLKFAILKAEGEYFKTASRMAQAKGMTSLHSLKRNFARANTIYLLKTRVN